MRCKSSDFHVKLHIMILANFNISNRRTSAYHSITAIHLTHY